MRKAISVFVFHTLSYRPAEVRRPWLIGIAALTLCGAFGGCGDTEHATQRSVPGVTPPEDVPGGPLDTSTTPAPPVPAESEIRSKQEKKPGPKPTFGKTQQDRDWRSARTTNVEPSKDTAPNDVLHLGTKAAAQWVAWRVDAITPDPEVIPESVSRGIPPLSPEERMKGSAGGSKTWAFDAHPEGDGWVVVNSTQDARVWQVAVTIEGPVGGRRVTAITDQGEADR